MPDTVEILSSLTAGAVLGLSAGFAPGPLITLVIMQTLKHGMREGFKVCLAPLITDLPIILASIFVLNRLARFERMLGVISCAGGFYVLYLAYEYIRINPIALEAPKDQPHSLRKGALINALNPHPYLFWITVGAPLFLKFMANNFFAPFLFISCFYVFLIGSKVSVTLIAGKSRTFLTSKGYTYLMRILGGLLAIFALLLLKEALILLGMLSS